MPEIRTSALLRAGNTRGFRNNPALTSHLLQLPGRHAALTMPIIILQESFLSFIGDA